MMNNDDNVNSSSQGDLVSKVPEEEHLSGISSVDGRPVVPVDQVLEASRYLK